MCCIPAFLMLSTLETFCPDSSLQIYFSSVFFILHSIWSVLYFACTALHICLCHMEFLLHLLKRPGTCWVALDPACRDKISLRPLYKQISSILAMKQLWPIVTFQAASPKCVSSSTPGQEERSCLSGNQTKWLYMYCRCPCLKAIEIQGFSYGFCSPGVLVHMN